MCVLEAVIAVASSAVSFMGAQADYKAREAQWEQNKENALVAATEEQKQTQLRMIQEGEAKTQKDQLTHIEQAEAVASAESSAASAGVSGISLGNIIGGINAKVRMKREADETNHQNTIAQLGMELKASNTRAENRINSVARPTAPNPLGYALQGAGGALGAMKPKV